MDPNEYADTGYGWMAYEDWLFYTSMQIGTVNMQVLPYDFPHIPEQTGYYTPTAAEIMSAGASFVAGGTTYYVLFQCNNVVGNIGIGIRQNGTDPAIIVLLAREAGASIGRYNTHITDGTQVWNRWRSAARSLTFTSGEWYYADTVGVSDVNSGLAGLALSDGTILIGNPDLSALLARYTSVSYPVLKDNNGWAVACRAKWKTGAVTIDTPVLISSNSDYTDMTITGGSWNIAKLSILRQGMRFYMAFFDIVNPPYSTAAPTLETFDKSAPSNADLTLEQVFNWIASGYYASINVYSAPDPYEEEDGASEEDGGEGEDPEDDPVEEQTNPLPSVAGLGFCTVYVPSQSELLAMSSYLWSGSFDVTQVIKLFSNPLDSIIGLSAVPVDLVGVSPPDQIYLGGVALPGVTMPRYEGRTAVKVDMGTVTIKERYGAYLDYDPYTEFAIYVPFIGIKNLKADDIMGKTLSLMYDIDILTGACVAYLRPAGGSVLYEWAGQCAQQIPVTSSNWDNIFRNAMTAATTLGTSLFAPASAPVLAGAVASAATQAIAAKPRVDRSGALTGVSGWLGQLRPYIIRTIPEAYIPADQNKFVGYPAYINVNMSDISGYNEVASLHLEGIPATGNELAEIESLLKGGVIF